MRNVGQKFIGAILIVAILLPATFIKPQKAHAQFVPVHDSISLAAISGLFITSNIIATQTAIATGAQTLKEVGNVPGISPLAQATVNPLTAPALGPTSVDFWARTVANFLINAVVNDIVGWIDSGFQGSPGFVRDPSNFFLNIADSVAGDFIDNTPWEFLCEPFGLDIKIALNYRYSSTFEERITCKLSNIINNVEDYAKFTEGDFINQGGWDSWFEIIQPNNNPYGSYLAAEAELGVRITSRQNIELLKLNWGNGFLSFQEECQDPPGAPPDECRVPGQIKTPGKIIETGIGQIVGSDLTDLQLADGFDRIINALLNQLINRALGSTGLL